MTITVLKSIVTGVGGSFVLAVFCTTFLTVEKVLTVLPLFVAFNGVLTGYRLVEALKQKLDSIPLFSIVLGAGTGAATFLVINFVGHAMKNPFSLTLADLFIYMSVCAVTSYLGAKLAVRYFNL